MPKFRHVSTGNGEHWFVCDDRRPLEDYFKVREWCRTEFGTSLQPILGGRMCSNRWRVERGNEDKLHTVYLDVMISGEHDPNDALAFKMRWC